MKRASDIAGSGNKKGPSEDGLFSASLIASEIPQAPVQLLREIGIFLGVVPQAH